MLVDCRGGFYVLAFGFTGDAVLADGSVVLEWGGDGLVERQHYPAAPVGDQFQLTGARRALDALNCPHR